MTVTIRRIRPDDGPQLRALRLRAIEESPTAFGSTLAETAARSDQDWSARAARDAVSTSSVLFVAEEGDRWVGLAGCFIEEPDGEANADLISMWVDPAYRGRGLGRRLVERIVDFARSRGLPSLSLWVTDGNESAIALYRSCGFKATDDTQPLPSHPTLLERRMVLELA